MTPGARMAVYAAALGVVLGAAALAGAVVGPLRDAEEAAAPHAGDPHAAAGAGEHPADAARPVGLAVAEGGYTLVPERTALPAGRTAELAFRITGPDGHAVRDFEVEHERRMHLIVVPRDLDGYQHLHPTADATGRWSIPLRLPRAGVYRVYADFHAAGRARTLATDVFVGGEFRPRALPAPRAVDEAGRYRVTLHVRGAAMGRRAELAYQVTRDGRPVTGIQPYLGADGHLVSLREGDLAFLHAHPEAGDPGRGAIRFAAEFPSAGRYRLFLQFRHDGEVRTVAHTVEVSR